MVAVTRDGQTHRKEDTVLLLNVGVSATDDLGNEELDLTASANGSYRNNSDHLNVVGDEAELSVQVDLVSGDTGAVLFLGDSDNSHGVLISFDGSGNVQFGYALGAGLVNLKTMALPNVDVALDRTYTIQWCIRANKFLTTGASDAFRSEFTIIDNDTADSYSIAQETHLDLTPTISGNFTVSQGMRWDGAENDVFTGTVAWVRVGDRFHSTTEAKADWVSAFAAPSNDGQARVQQCPMPNRMGVEAEFAGHQLLYADMAHKRNAMRLLSPLVNEAYLSPVEMTDDLLDDVHDSMIITSPGTTDFQAHLGLLRYRICPNTFNKATVRCSGQLWAIAGVPDNVEVRCYSANHPPGAVVANPVRKSVTLTYTDDDTSSGPPTWKAANLAIARDDDGWTWLWLAFRHNAGVASLNNRFKLWAWHVDPIVVPLANDEDNPPIQLPP